MFPAGKNVRGSLKNIAENAGEVSFMCEPCFKNGRFSHAVGCETLRRFSILIDVVTGKLQLWPKLVCITVWHVNCVGKRRAVFFEEYISSHQ